MSLTMRTALVSDAGLVRENNEDAAHAGSRLIVVADGVGGQPTGEVASEIMVRVLASVDEPAAAAPGGDPAAALRDAVMHANQHIRNAGRANRGTSGMATTVTAIVLDGDRLCIVHVGDSRGYLLHDGDLRQITRDDTYVQELVDGGYLTAAQARRHPQRSLITNAVQGGDLTPATATLPGAAGDRLLLCSDGLSDVVPDETIAATLRTYGDPEDCAAQLIKEAYRAGAPDNVTVVVADLVPA
ncbi:MAG TPA: protein phosphatase 2C domain-containing protein [Micromonosporaceae bacterium]